MTVGLDIRLPFRLGDFGHSLRSSFRVRARGLPWSDARVRALPPEAPIAREAPVQVPGTSPDATPVPEEHRVLQRCLNHRRAMVILRFKIYSKPDKSDELMAALAEIITPARATEGVVEFDIARVLRDPDSFIATAIYEDGAALERQESLAEVHRVMAMLPESLVAPPERTIFDAALDPTLV